MCSCGKWECVIDWLIELQESRKREWMLLIKRTNDWIDWMNESPRILHYILHRHTHSNRHEHTHTERELRPRRTCRWKKPKVLKSLVTDNGIGSFKSEPVRTMAILMTFILGWFGNVESGGGCGYINAMVGNVYIYIYRKRERERRKCCWYCTINNY